jgi:NAD(P)-dependent dehydrogenase (short-subunit alcohol dehydrogenase family)
VSATRVCAVIGGARGIGAATAATLAARGDAVLIVDRAADDPRLPYSLATRDDLDHAVATAHHAAPDPTLIDGAVADATDQAAVATVLDDLVARHGGLDAFIVTAGVIAGGVPLWEMPADELQAVLDVDLAAVIAASRGLPLLAAYGAAKAGVVGLIRGLAAELRATGITANAVSPGSTDTPILAESARLYGLSGAQDFALQQPIERLIDASEVATLIAWLAGPDSGAATGTDHAIDGGLAV